VGILEKIKTKVNFVWEMKFQSRFPPACLVAHASRWEKRT